MAYQINCKNDSKIMLKIEGYAPLRVMLEIHMDGSTNYTPYHRKFLKIPPCPAKPALPSVERSLAANFKVFWGIFRGISGNLVKFRGFFVIFMQISYNLTGFSFIYL